MRSGRMAWVGLTVALVVLTACDGADEAAENSSSVAPGPADTVADGSPDATAAPTTSSTSTTTSTAATTTTMLAAPRLDTSEPATLLRMQTDLAALLSRGPRVAGSDAEIAAAGYVTEQLRRLGLRATAHPVALPNRLTSQNVITVIGTGDRHVMLGAHIDSITGSPGADDNGSGTVALLELARRLQDDVPNHLTISIVFFGAEEVLAGYDPNDHHYGSRQLASELLARSALPDEMLSVDMIGVDNSLLAVTYRDSDAAAAERLVDAGAAVDATVVIASKGDISDHEAFARVGVPSAMMWRPSNPAYHTDADTVVDWSHMLTNLAVIEAWLALQPST